MGVDHHSRRHASPGLFGEETPGGTHHDQVGVDVHRSVDDRFGGAVTLDEAKPTVDALAIRDGTVVALGTAEEIEPFVGEVTEVLDLEGRLAIPGFIEGHGHFLGMGLARMQLDLMGTTRWQQIVDLVAERVAEDADLRALVRERTRAQGTVRAAVIPGREQDAAKFRHLVKLFLDTKADGGVQLNLIISCLGQDSIQR